MITFVWSVERRQVVENARFKSAAEFAVSEIRRLILSGELEQNERIDQVQMAERLGLSRLPVRQALDRLSEQGFIRLVPHRGAVVAPLSVEDMEELYEARQGLEDWALRAAWPRYTAALRRELKAHLELAAAAIDRDALDDFMAANRAFHLTMYRPAGNRYLQSMIVKLYDLSERYQRTSLQRPQRMRLSDDHHRAMLNAIEAKDLDGLLQARAEHNGATKRTVLEATGA